MPCKLTIGILANVNAGVRSISDLRGKKVAVLEGTAMHFALLRNAQHAGLNPAEFEVINMAPPEGKSAFDTDQVQAWAVWPPWAEQEEIAGRGAFIPGSEVTIEALLVLRSDFARRQPELVDAILRVSQNAREWIAKNSADAQGIVSRRLKLPLVVVAKSWPLDDFEGTLTDPVIDDIQGKADVLYQSHYIKRPVNVRKQLVDLSHAR
jgi:sulfonate transport system substrate-binding protein